MKRDIDLIRQILLELEEKGAYTNWMDIDIEDYSPEQIDYHLELMVEAGLISVRTSEKEYSRQLPLRLTWEGHEFLDAVRNEPQWHKVKESIKLGNNVPFHVIETLLFELAKRETQDRLLLEE